MSGDLYRDAHVGIRARLGELATRIEDREAQVADAFWDTLAADVLERLLALRDAMTSLEHESLAELARAEGDLAAYLEELERIITTLPALEEAWLELPDDVEDPPKARMAWDDLTPSFDDERELLRTLTATVRERARDAVVVQEDNSMIARFRENGCPFVLRATMHPRGNQLSEISMCLVTSIPRALPRLVVRHETLVLSVGKALGIRREVEVGEPSFDGLFLIEGSREAADLFLVPAFRTQLLALSRFDVPTLDVSPESRTVSLSWRFEPAAKALDAAVRVLTAVRMTPPSVTFRAEAPDQT